MGRHIEELREMLCGELDQIASKGELTAGSLDTVDKLTHSIKSIDTIMAMEEGGYSNEGGNSMRGGSYAQRRDSRGRYSRESYEGGSYARGGNRGGGRRGGGSSRGYSRDGYSYDSEELVSQLHELIEDADSEKERMAIHKVIKQLEG